MQDLKSLCRYYLRCIDAEQSNFYEIYSNNKRYILIDDNLFIGRAISGDINEINNSVQSMSKTFELTKDYTSYAGYPLLYINSLKK